MSRIIKNSKAVAPVVGTIVMIAVAVIFASIAVSAFGLDTIKKAPQADIRAVSDSIGTDSVIKMIHQGGEELLLSESRTKILISGTSGNNGEVSFTNLNTEDDRRFITGDSIYLYMSGGNICIANNTLPNADHTDIAGSGDTLQLRILDVNSQQMIADVDVRF
ncbi:type IV pilin N-terminal domain-containing protein [Methanolobus zinderi]|jgi:flagellin-like protein|uniref:Type IV pilin N-terminal domain-containing protein n=1 Tax=Methanolobus zinderi TaxID=536044 RepID=A0A7D5E6N3_9EURY|nr:type IV pilin N-terminal domain-containing protein [Methanolobus zinderi]QLC50013.1 type IV pilin N-terminal domain-containing protein [Methanolobus zinderi]